MIFDDELGGDDDAYTLRDEYKMRLLPPGWMSFVFDSLGSHRKMYAVGDLNSPDSRQANAGITKRPSTKYQVM